MITSGSCRTKARKALAKVSPIEGFTWDWFTPWISYSTGSSIVRIFRVGSLRIERMVASVVVFPLPVGPVTTIIPCGSCNNRASLPSSAGRQAELVDREQAAVFRQQTDHRRFAMLRRHDRNANVEIRFRNTKARRPILRQAPFGDVKARQYLDARNHRLRRHAGRRRHGPQQAVDPHANHQRGSERLDVNVARAQLQRLFQQIINRAYDRSAACEIAQAVDVIIGAAERPLAIGPGQRCVVTPDLFRECGRNILKRRNFNRHRATQHDFGSANTGRIGWIGYREPQDRPARLDTGKLRFRAGSDGRSYERARTPPSVAADARGAAGNRPPPRRQIRVPEVRSVPTISSGVVHRAPRRTPEPQRP